MVAGMKKVFISYSWDSDDHKKWVRDLAARLRGDGIDVTLDQWHLVPGDQLPQFMEQAIRESNYVLIVCTHKYKDRSDKRQGGVGNEGDIITAEFMTTHNHSKFIPLLRQQSWSDSAPSWMLGKYFIDFSSSPYSEKSYEDLQSTILGTREKAPPVGTAKKSTPPIIDGPLSKATPPINLFRTIESGSSIIALSPDGNNIFIALENGTIQVWDIASGKMLDKVTWKDRVIESLVCPNNSKLIATSTPERNVDLWDFLSLPRLTPVLRLWHVTNGVFSLGGDLTFLGGSPTMRCKAILTEHDSVIGVSRKINTSVKHPFDEGGVELYTNIISLHRCNFDTRQKVSFTQIRTIESITHRNFNADASSCAISPNGKLHVFSLPDETILRSEQSTISLFKKPCHLLMFSPDNRFVIGETSEQIMIWNTQSGKILQTLDGKGPAISPDGKLLASVTGTGDIKLWKTTDWTVLTELKQPTGQARRIIFSRTGDVMASTDYYKTFLWRLQS